MVFCDRIGASQEIHLFRPLRRAVSAGECVLEIYDEARLAASGVTWLNAEIAHFRPLALLFSRFAHPSAADICNAAKRAGLPIITHLDDFLLGVPDDVGAEKAAWHRQPERIAAIEATLRNATLLYLSTEPLAARIRAAGFGAPVIVSALQACADPNEIASPPGEEEVVRIGYQGTASHGPDLALIEDALLAVMAARPHAQLSVFGTIKPSARLTSLGDRLSVVPPAHDYSAFLTQLKQLRWHIGLAPLRDTEFNSFRTYTKWTEYSIAGAAVVASATGPYSDLPRETALLPQNAEWETMLLRCIDDAALRANLASAAQARLRSKLTLAAQEQQLRVMLANAGVTP